MKRVNWKKFQIFQNEWVIGLLLLTMVVLARLPSVPQSFDNDSGGSAYHGQLILQGEPLYGSHHPGHQLPGVYYTYAFIFGLLGNTTPALKIFLIGWVWLNACLMYRIGRQLRGKFVGVLAAVFFILVSAATSIAGDTGEIEMFANLPLTLTIWLGLEFIQKRRPPAAFALVGISGAISFLYKANYLSTLGSVCAGLLLLAVLEGRREAWLELLKRAAAILLGMALTLSPVIAYFAGVGVLPRLWLVFSLGAEYMVRNNSIPLVYIFLIAPVLVARANALLVLLGLFGAGRALFSLPKIFKDGQQKGVFTVILLLWLFSSIVAAGISRLFFPHYTLLAVPPLAMFVAMEIAELFERRPEPAVLTQRKRFLGTVLLLAVLVNSFFSAREYIGGYLGYASGQISLDEFVSKDTMMGPDRIDAIQLATYLRAHTSPQDTIFDWTDEAEIYYLSGRRSSSENIWPPDIALLGPPERVFTSRPKYIVVGRTYFDRGVVVPDWLAKELASSYRLETTLASYQVYRRIAP